jgi:hypothetical protein
MDCWSFQPGLQGRKAIKTLVDRSRRLPRRQESNGREGAEDDQQNQNQRFHVWLLMEKAEPAPRGLGPARVDGRRNRLCRRDEKGCRSSARFPAEAGQLIPGLAPMGKQDTQ